MLLSAKRSVLILPDPTADPALAEQKANLSLLTAAAQRLQVPCCIPGTIPSAAATGDGRDQLVFATAQLQPAAAEGLQRFLVVDCLPAQDRPATNSLIGEGVTAVTAEMVVFEWLERADTADFRALLKLIR
ncbi:hypothetical protein HBA54_09670 [Pelagibius litoralis]|uniref:Uncharacterized protein n=1 Tax=Pelagibius litoralis TaxID=374515 RepID=A0A967C526_9PROT|nr:hypothetical protein [Pelagibius litoralis]NIA68859.1 hypothetical protein [Pelagibius litoralis]